MNLLMRFFIRRVVKLWPVTLQEYHRDQMHGKILSNAYLRMSACKSPASGEE